MYKRCDDDILASKEKFTEKKQQLTRKFSMHQSKQQFRCDSLCCCIETVCAKI